MAELNKEEAMVEVLVVDETVGERKSRVKRYGCNVPWNYWLKFCHFCNDVVGNKFGKLAEVIAMNPLLTICMSVLIVSVFCTGFLFMRTENNIEKLYIPQDTMSTRNLKKAREYGFDKPSRRIDVILVRANDTANVLTEECLKDASELHKVITSLQGYTDVCLPNLAGGQPCVNFTPVNLIASVDRSFQKILNRLNEAEMLLVQNLFGQINRDSSGRILSAKALRLVYFLKGAELGQQVPRYITDWELRFLNAMRSLNHSRIKCGRLFFSATRSLDDAMEETTNSDVLLVSITFTVMIGFACSMLSKFQDHVTGHGLLAMGGVLCVNLGIGAAFGLALYCKVPFISIVGILPFLVVGVGIDDMFLIVDELDRTNSDQALPVRLGAVMKRIGPAIAMTTVTDLVAFAVGTMSIFPSIVYFCKFAALSISFAFILLVTLFMAFMTYDCKRIASHRMDILFCRKIYSFDLVAGTEARKQTSNRMMEKLGRFLMRPSTKIVVVVLSISLLVVGIYGTMFINEEFDRRNLAKDDSEYIRFLDASEENFKDGTQVDLILESGVNYTDPDVRVKIDDVLDVVKKNCHYENNVVSWLHEFQKWSDAQTDLDSSKPFITNLKTFLDINPKFRADVVLTSDNKSIEASRFYGFIKQTKSSVTLRNAMCSLRSDLAEKSDLPIIASSYYFIFFEQFVSTLPETIRNLALAAVAILVITAFFLINPLVVLLVCIGFISLIFELLGLMFVWGVSLNSISMINLVMAIGFAVDYSAHVAHAFVFSSFVNTEEKVVDALRTVGASVLMGGFSTFLGMIVTAFASSEVFRIFFKMFFGVVVLGLLHGLCFLPVWLSILCRQQLNKKTGTKETNIVCAESEF